MSRTVDKRIVQMEFDNSRFERNVKTTRESLGKLKKSLKFDDSNNSFDKISDGFNKINESAKKTNFANVQRGIDQLSVKFSALQVVGVTALMNITNQAIATGMKITNALTIDPVRTGFSEYETKINSIQTILANTQSKGTTLTQVNKALDELNLYADKTIYNFQEMTRNIGTFTAAGIELDTAVSGIKGIANLAAVSGSTSQQASMAMYQLSQALASGTVKLMDWNSVVNAGMGGQVFQDSLKETARVHGIAIDDIIKKEGSFRESLSQGWLTSQILTETLAKFTGDLNEEQLRSMGYTDEQIKKIIKLGKTANEAATKVKTFTQLWDTLREAAQSGWGETWSIIIGDFEEARTLLTSISDTLGGFISNFSNSLNSTLSGALSTGWKQLLKAGISDEEGFKEMSIKVAKEHGVNIDSIIKKHGSFNESLKSGWLKSDIVKESLQKMIDKTKGMSDEQLKSIGYTRQQVTAMESLNQKIQNGSINIDDYVKKISRISGRENLIIAAKNAFGGLFSIIKSIASAYREVFPKITSDRLYDITVKIREFSEHLKISGEALSRVKQTFTGFFHIIHAGFVIVSMFVKATFSIVGSILKFASSIFYGTAAISKHLAAMDEYITKSKKLSSVFELITSIFGELLNKLSNIIPAIVKTGSKVSDVVIDIFKSIFKYISELDFSEKIRVFDFGVFSLLIVGALKLLKDFRLKLKNVTNSATSFLSGFDKIFSGIKGVLDGTRECLSKYQKEIQAKTLKEIAKAILLLAVALVLISTINPKKLAMALAAISGLFIELMYAIKLFSKNIGSVKHVASLVFMMQGLSASVLILSIALKTISSIKPKRLAASLAAIAGLMTVMVFAIEHLSKNSKKMKPAISGIIAVAFSVKILAGALKSLSDINPKKMASGLIGVSVLLAAIGLFINNIKYQKGSVRAALSIIMIAASLKILASVCSDFANISKNGLVKSIIAIGAVLLELTVIMGIAKHLGGGIGSASAILIMAISLKVLSSVLKTIGDMKASKVSLAIKVIAIALAELAIGLHLMRGTLGGSLALIVATNSLLVLALALGAIGSLKISTIVKSLVTIGAAMLTISAISVALLPAAAAIGIFGAVLGVFGLAMITVGLGMSAIGVGLAALSAGIASISGLKNVVLEFTKEFFGSIVEVLTENLPNVVDALAEAIMRILRALKKYGPEIVEVILDLIINLIVVLTKKIPRIINVLFDFFAALFNSIAKVIKRANPEKLKSLVTSIGIIAAIMAGLSFMVGLIPGAMVGLLGLAAFVAELGLIIAAFGALSKIPGLSWLIKEGGNFLEVLGTAIGKFIGGIAGGVMAGVSESLPEIGKNMSAFMKEIKPFIDGASSIDPKAMDGVKTLAETILILTASSFLDGIAKFLGFGKDISEFGEQLSSFTPYIKNFATDMASVDPKAIEGASNAAKAIASLSDAIPKSGGVWQLLFGSKNLDMFGLKLRIFGSSLLEYSESVKGIDSASIENSAKAAMAITEVAKNLPETDGLFKFNDTNLGDLGESLKPLGYGLAEFSESVSGYDEASVHAAIGSIKELSDLAKYVQNGGIASKEDSGFLSNLFGFAKGSDQLDFASTIVPLANGLKQFSTTVQDIDMEAADMAISYLRKMNSLLASIVSIDPKSVSNFTNGINDIGNISASAIAKSIQNGGEKVRSAGKSLMNKLASGIRSGKNSVRNSAESAGSSAVSGLNSSGIVDSFYNIGYNATVGLENGLKSRNSAIWNAGWTIGDIAKRAAAAALDEHSPSKEMNKVGRFAVLGFIQPFSEMVSDVANAGYSIGNSAINSVKDAVKNISDIIDGSMDLNPVIKPLVDTSEISKAASYLDASLSRKLAYGINSTMSPNTNVSDSNNGVSNNNTTVNYVQNNYSPKELSRIDIYRQTKTQLASVERLLK